MAESLPALQFFDAVRKGERTRREWRKYSKEYTENDLDATKEFLEDFKEDCGKQEKLRAAEREREKEFVQWIENDIEELKSKQVITKKQITTIEKFSFKFKGDVEKLKTVIFQLCNKIGLLNEDKTDHQEFLTVLTAKELQQDAAQIHLGCETTQFRYIIDKLSAYFGNLKLQSIEKSELFFSKKGTRITAQYLSSCRVESPKEQKAIDEILKHLH